jgi:hypothetical protein
MNRLIALFAVACGITHAYASDNKPFVSSSPIEMREEGVLDIPPNGRKSAYLVFNKSIYPATQVTDSLKQKLEAAGYQWQNDESSAKLVMTMSGNVEIFNELNDTRMQKGTTGKVDLGRVLEDGLIIADQSATQANRGALNFDAGISQQTSRLASSQGPSHSADIGVGAAIALDWLAEATGLRDSINRAFNKVVFGKNFPNKQLFCGDECQQKYSRVHHRVSLNVRVWKDRQAKDFTIIADRVDKEIGDPMPVIEKAMMAMVSRIAEAH